MFTGISELVSLQGAQAKEGRHVGEEDLSVVTKAALLVVGGKVAWVGPQKSLKSKMIRELTGKSSVTEVHLKGASVIPGLTECHTHLVFAGDRAQEFEWRNQGVTYQEISARGGGIRSTMKATREATPKVLKSLAQERVNRFVRQGVTTLEIKSGYGLNSAAEEKCLKVAGALNGPHVVRTFLGPHALPPEFVKPSDYVEHLVKVVLPTVKKKKLAERVDVFVEQGFFSLAEAQSWFEAAKGLGFELVAHVDQLTAGGGAAWAAALGARSVDHCIHMRAAEIEHLAKSQTTAVLLPTADFYLKMNYPPARSLIDSGARVALATDFNPGTSPTQDLSFVGVLARLEMKMTQAEVLSAYTVGAAHALGRAAEEGSLEIGKAANFAVVDGVWRDLFYRVGHHPISSTWRSGQRLI